MVDHGDNKQPMAREFHEPSIPYKIKGVNVRGYGEGGKVYGDKELSILHLGSGGGSIMKAKGGNGGGAIRIKCLGNFILNGKAKITANGEAGDGAVSGCGSGGSIHIIVGKKENLQINDVDRCEIRAKGEKNYSPGGSGDGGYGRIRVECVNDVMGKSYFKKMEACFEPKPYIG